MEVWRFHLQRELSCSSEQVRHIYCEYLKFLLEDQFGETAEYKC